MLKTKYLDKSFIEQEEREAEEKGMTLFQYRHYKKMKEKAKENSKKTKERRKKETLKKKEAEKKKKQKLKERLKKKKEKEKEILKEKKKIKPKKMGRPKKRGPKKKYKRKKNIVVERKKLSWPYKIVSVKNGRQTGYVGKYRTVEDAYNKIEELLKESDKVVFANKVSNCDELDDTICEYLILERKNETNDKPVLLRNEVGKLVEQRTNSKNSVIYDKFKYNEEETFWVWGYSNKVDRKTFMWIYENIVLKHATMEYEIVRVLIYKNKVIFKYDDNSMDVIFCKTMSETVRFYNLLEEYCKKDKLKQVFFVGSYNTISDKRRKLENELMELTGWTKRKVQMSSTTKHTIKKQ